MGKTEPAYTLGPWTASPPSSVVGIVITAQPDTKQNQTMVAGVMSGAGNARLIAAAPDLLKASQAAWHAMQSLLAMRDGMTDDALRDVATALDTAIAKAVDRG